MCASELRWYGGSGVETAGSPSPTLGSSATPNLSVSASRLNPGTLGEDRLLGKHRTCAGERAGSGEKDTRLGAPSVGDSVAASPPHP